MPADRAQLSHHLRQDRAQKARGGNEVKERLAKDTAERRPHPSPCLALPRALRLGVSRDLLHRRRTLAVGVGALCYAQAARWRAAGRAAVSRRGAGATSGELRCKLAKVPYAWAIWRLFPSWWLVLATADGSREIWHPFVDLTCRIRGASLIHSAKRQVKARARAPAGRPSMLARACRRLGIRPRSYRRRASRPAAGGRMCPPGSARAPTQQRGQRSLRNSGMSISSSLISSEERWRSSIVTSRS